MFAGSEYLAKPPHEIFGLISRVSWMAVYECVLGMVQSVVVDESIKEKTEAIEEFLPRTWWVASRSGSSAWRKPRMSHI